MSANLPEKKTFSISEAARFLGVSPETLRRWDRKGILKPYRTKGNQRRYSLANLEAFKAGEKTPRVPLSISQAAEYVGVHPETLRRWEKEGVIAPKRTNGNQRRYTREELDQVKVKPEAPLPVPQAKLAGVAGAAPPPPPPSPQEAIPAEEPPPSLPTRIRVRTMEEYRPRWRSNALSRFTRMYRPRGARMRFPRHYLFRKLAVVTLALVVASFAWGAVPPLSKARIGRFFATSPLNPIVDVNDIFEYSRIPTDQNAEARGNVWLRSKFPLEVGQLVTDTLRVFKDGVFNTTRLLGTLFFGRGKDYFITPLADAYLRNLDVGRGKFTVSGKTGATAIKTSMTSGTALEISFENPIQTGDLTGIEVDFGKIIDPLPTDTRYGVHLKDAPEPTAIDYGVYVQGTNWDYGIYSEDDLYVGGDTEIEGKTEIGRALTVGGPTTLNDTLTVNGDTTITGNLLPGIDSTFDIGATGREWANLYVDDITADTIVSGDTTLSSLTVTGQTDLQGDVLDTTGNLTLNDTVDITGGLNLPEDKKVQFRDPQIYVHSGADGYLNLVADSAIRLSRGGASAGKLEFWDGSAFSINLYAGTSNVLETDDSFWVGTEIRAGYWQPLGSTAFKTLPLGDTSWARFFILNSGELRWGPGNAPGDTNLYRSAANTLKTDDYLVVGEDLTVGAAAADDNDTIFFDDGSSAYLIWYDSAAAFAFTHNLSTMGNQLGLKSAGPDEDQFIYFYEDGSPTGEYFSWNDTTGEFNLSDDLNLAGDLTVSGQGFFNHPPTQAHTSTWAIGSGTWNQNDASIYINPATSVGDGNLIAAAVGGSVVFAVDAEGDIYGNNMILTGSVSQGTTIIAGDLRVEGNTTLGDAPTDSLTIYPSTVQFISGSSTLDIYTATGDTTLTIDSSGTGVAHLTVTGDLTVQGTTGGTFSGAGAGIDFSGGGNHLVQSSGGTLQLGALTLTGAVAGNNQNITGLNNVTGVTSTWSTSVTSPLHTGAGAVTFSSGGGLGLTVDSASGIITFATGNDLIPTLGAGTADIGSSGTPWDNLYATNYYQGSTAIGIWLDGGTYIYPSNVGTSYQIVDTTGDTTIAGDLTVVGGEVTTTQDNFTFQKNNAAGTFTWQNSAPTTLMTLNNTGQLALPTQGSTGGLVIGGDTNLYRSNTDTLRTDDSFQVAAKTGLGSGSIVPTDQTVFAKETYTNTSGERAVIFAEIAANPTADSTGNFYGGQSIASGFGSFDISALWGINAKALHYGTGTISQAAGNYASIENTSTGIINNAYSFYTSRANLSTGIMDNVYGFWVGDAQNSGGGTLNNNYGIYIGNQTAGGSSDIGLYIADADTYSLQLASNDGDPASGITFGTDTNLYRSAANTLKTDDDFIVGGNLTIGGTSIFSGDLTVTGHILPSANDQYDLGSDTARWRDLYLGAETIHLGTSTANEATISYTTSLNDLEISNTYGDIVLQPISGSVGIGTASPQARLHVAENDSATPDAVVGTYLGASSDVIGMTSLEVGDDDNDAWVIVGQGASRNLNLGWVYNATPANAIAKIGTYGNSNRLEIDGSVLALQFNSGGNVGIGTTGPDSKLHVLGPAGAVSYAWSHSADTVAIIENNDNAYIDIVSSGASFKEGGIAMGEPSGRVRGGLFYKYDTDDLYLYGAGVERLRIGNDGKLWIDSGVSIDTNLYRVGSNLLGTDDSFYVGGSVGIGTTGPKTKLEILSDTDSNQPGDRLEVMRLTRRSSSANQYLRAELFYGPYGYGYGFTPRYYNGSAYVDGSTFLIDAYGNVGIGAASPGAKLDVNGAILQTTGALRKYLGYTIDYNSVGDGTYYGYLLLAKAHTGGLLANSEVQGTFTFSRGSAGSGNRTDVFSVHSKRSYDSEYLVVHDLLAKGSWFVKTCKITYSGTIYHAIKLPQTGGGPGNMVSFDGYATADAGLIIVRNDQVSGETNFGNVGLFVNESGYVGIGTTGPGTKLSVAGLTSNNTGYNVMYDLSTGDFYYFASSLRYKDNVQPFDTDFIKILQAQPKAFTWKSTGQADIGYIAEDFDELGLKDLVVYDSQGRPDAIKYNMISLYLLEVMRDQQAQIEELKSMVLVDSEGDLAQETTDGTMEKIITSEVEAEEGIFQRLTATIEAVFNHIKAQTIDVLETLTAKLIKAKRLEADSAEVKEFSVTETSGRAVVLAGESSKFVENTYAKKDSKVFITFKDPYRPATQYWVSEIKEGKGFTLTLDQAVESEAAFDYWIVN